MLRKFRLVLGFMTRIPVHIDWEVKNGELERGISYFPIVGLVLGFFCALSYIIFSYIFPNEIAILFGMLTLIGLTGGFHIDGLADTADGIYSARDRSRMLEIMKDSRLGTNGAIAVLFDLAFRFFSLCFLSDIFNENTWMIFLILPVCGKMVQGIIGYRAVYARKQGIGFFIGTLKGRDVCVCSFLGLAMITAAYGILGLAAGGILFFLLFLFRTYTERILGGITGDVMGAANEIAEVGFLLIFCVFFRFL